MHIIFTHGHSFRLWTTNFSIYVYYKGTSTLNLRQFQKGPKLWIEGIQKHLDHCLPSPKRRNHNHYHKCYWLQEKMPNLFFLHKNIIRILYRKKAVFLKLKHWNITFENKNWCLKLKKKNIQCILQYLKIFKIYFRRVSTFSFEVHFEKALPTRKPRLGHFNRHTDKDKEIYI